MSMPSKMPNQKHGHVFGVHSPSEVLDGLLPKENHILPITWLHGCSTHYLACGEVPQTETFVLPPLVFD